MKLEQNIKMQLLKAIQLNLLMHDGKLTTNGLNTKYFIEAR